MLNLVTLTNLYPNSVQTRHGTFVEERLRLLVASGGLRAEVIAPVPWFPSSSPIFGRYAISAAVPRVEVRAGLTVRHPRFPALPRVGMAVAPFLYAAGVSATLRQVLSGLEGPVLLDGHFLYPDGVATALLARRYGLPFILTARGQDVTLFPRHAVPRRLIRWACAASSRVITVSEALREQLVDIGVAPDKACTLRNGVDTDKFRPAERAAARQRFGCQRTTLLAVGHLIERKDHDLIVRALPLLPDMDLVIVGEGPLRQRLLDTAARLRVAGRVRIVGHVSQAELAIWYTAADISILTSRHEGMPNVVLESLACGTPVVATVVEGVPELIDSAAAGRLVMQRTPEALAAAVRRLAGGLPPREATRAHAMTLGWGPTIEGLRAVICDACGGDVLDSHEKM